MSKTKTTKKPAAPQARVTDDELLALMTKHLAKEPDASRLAILTAVRALGKSVSGGRVRALYEQAGKAAAKAPRKAAAATKPRTKAQAA